MRAENKLQAADRAIRRKRADFGATPGTQVALERGGGVAGAEAWALGYRFRGRVDIVIVAAGGGDGGGRGRLGEGQAGEAHHQQRAAGCVGVFLLRLAWGYGRRGGSAHEQFPVVLFVERDAVGLCWGERGVGASDEGAADGYFGAEANDGACNVSGYEGGDGGVDVARVDGVGATEEDEDLASAMGRDVACWWSALVM